MTMVTYLKLPEKKDADFLVLTDHKDILVADSYCANPDCDCKEINFCFFRKTNDDRMPLSPLFYIYYDMDTWSLSGRSESAPRTQTDLKLIEAIQGWIDGKSKARLLARFAEVQAYAKKYPTIYMDFSDYDLKDCLAYSRLFADEDIDQFSFVHGSKTYFINDQYCIDPDCDCNHVFLEFFELVPDQDQTDQLFSIDYNFDGSLTFEQTSCDDALMYRLIEEKVLNNRPFQVLLEQRYRKMKEMGKKVVIQKMYKSLKQPLARKVKVGRNEPCPCGSGKKYKKCCGVV